MSEAPEPNDCSEGCTEECDHKWVITPHPYDQSFDSFATDSDTEARITAMFAAEQAWDQAKPGETVTISITMRKS